MQFCVLDFVIRLFLLKVNMGLCLHSLKWFSYKIENLLEFENL